MNNKNLLSLGATLLLGTSFLFAQAKPVDYVNPIIGTNGMGHTFPGACTPFGWVQLSPDTDTIPHNINGAYQKMLMSIAPDTNIVIRPLSASATPISAEQGTRTWETSC